MSIIESLGREIQLFIKSLFDYTFSFILVFITLPVFLIVSIIIKLNSQGPVFFVQERPGFKGRLFKVFKFRTMYLGSNKMIKGKEVKPDDERITKPGKFLRRFKIDELPQLINVLKGEMSLVGPRPERVQSLADYDEEIRKRLLMKPGLTGLAQVSGNICITLEERYKYDVYYVENFSTWLDIRIFLRTIGVVIKGENRYMDRELVMVDTAADRSLQERHQGS